MDKNKSFTGWIVSEGLAGTENQCLGVAEAIQRLRPDFRYSVKQITLKEPWKTLSPYLGFEQWWSFNPLIYPPWPDLVISAGRKGIAPARYIKAASAGNSFILHLQDPRFRHLDFDLIAAPRHDRLRGPNVIVTEASPNRITENALREAKDNSPDFGTLSGPRIAVLLGGNSKTHRMDDDTQKDLLERLSKAAGQGTLMITPSRRTPRDFTEIIERKFGDKHFIWDGKSPNPYLAMLAWADYIFVTNDSSSMLSDAATTGKPVYMLPLSGKSPKFDMLYKSLASKNIVKEFTGRLEKWSYTPLKDSEKVAQICIKKMQGRGKS